ncbi:MAG: flagellar type III secretion system protein FliR [Xanthobacteraceae bacterium]|nr:flagellar type III secretion system protein FliR [Xanthobacteraceae bacterium]MBX3548234.1 flagellar type III secretion system protein FliR [Xanthobacteraceae bacterium]MCW5679163.1 flagellar type III secretion system protein FliR [Xanthobacteraceae bacterium]
MQVNISFLPALAVTFMLMFARLGTMTMLMPGIGERGIPTRIRLVTALMLTLVLLPIYRSNYPTVPMANFAPIVGLLIQEVIVGAVLGLTARLTLSALEVAGATIANQMGLGFATAVDPNQGQQGIIVGNLLAMLGVALIFATDLHHLAIGALDQSYSLFRPGEFLPTSDVTQLMLTVVSGAFKIGVQLAAPFLVFGLLFNLGLGLLARLMPQLQVFFLGLPISLMIGFAMLFAFVGAVMLGFLGHLESVLLGVVR